jgi:hypothetical protein
LENKVHSTSSTFGNTNSFDCVCKAGITRLWFNYKEIFEGNTINKTTWITNGKAIGLEPNINSTKTRIITMNEGIDKGFPKGAAIV